MANSDYNPPRLTIRNVGNFWWAVGRTPQGGLLAFANSRAQLIARIDARARDLGWDGWLEANTETEAGG